MHFGIFVAPLARGDRSVAFPERVDAVSGSCETVRLLELKRAAARLKPTALASKSCYPCSPVLAGFDEGYS